MKENIQRFGRFLSGMVMPNIGAFIAWGIITALFIPDGYFPNESINALVCPMSTTLLTLLIAFTGGNVVAGHRGGVTGAIMTMGLIVGTDVPMFIGAMIAGPLGGYIIKKFDQFMENHIPAGFEMLINNFSVGIIGAILAVLALKGVTPLMLQLNDVMAAGVGFFVNHGLLPLASVFIEPAKVLFLNNALNHGILSPLGIEQVEQIGKSIFFLLEANPGPGLGVLLAYCIAGKGSAKSSAPGAIIIHFFGGIHEIYFPYILMNPPLILASIAGGACGVFTFHLLGAGLVSPASPGSIIALMAMCPKGGYLPVLAGVAISAVVSCVIAIILLKMFGKDQDLDKASKKVSDLKQASKGQSIKIAETRAVSHVQKIVFACDAGMGSSAMGATVLRKKLSQAGLELEVVHAPVSDIPQDADIVVTHQELGDRAKTACPTAEFVLITNFMNAPEYDELVNRLAGQ